MAKASVKLIGMNRLYKDLSAISDEIRGEVKQAVGDSLDRIKSSAESSVPVDTGKLRESISVNVSESGMGGTVTAGNSKARHAHLVEFGTVKTQAQPFLHPALEAEAPRYEAAVTAAVRRAGK